ncbi:hypothetical protein LEA_07765, partial [human gut metagenome]
ARANARCAASRQGLLVGFNIGARRMYLLSEVQEFIRKMRRRGKLESLNQ